MSPLQSLQITLFLNLPLKMCYVCCRGGRLLCGGCQTRTRLGWHGLLCQLHSAPESLRKQGGTSLWKVAMTSVSRACHRLEIGPLEVKRKKKKKEQRRKYRRSCCFEILCVLGVYQQICSIKTNRKPHQRQSRNIPPVSIMIHLIDIPFKNDR